MKFDFGSYTGGATSGTIAFNIVFTAPPTVITQPNTTTANNFYYRVHVNGPSTTGFNFKPYIINGPALTGGGAAVDFSWMAIGI